MQNNGIWIRIEFNTNNQYEGTDELLRELRQICPVQAPTRWYPAACTGLEFVLALNLNLSLSAFLNNVLIPGVEFAGVCAAAKRVWRCFEKFYRRNKEFEIKELELTFDDITLLLMDLTSYGALLRFYHELPGHLRRLESEGIKNISEIKVPYVQYTDEDNGEMSFREWSMDDDVDEDLYWRIVYERGLEVCFYNPQTRAVVA